MIDLKAEREKAGLTQVELAEKAYTSRTNISNIELGYNLPSVDIAKKIGQVLGFDWTDFFAE